IAWRIACSLACAPNCTLCEESMRTIAVERAEPGPELPVYHCTVSAEPLTRPVADVSGEPETLSGGRAAMIGLEVKPRAPSAAVFELVIESVEALGVLIVIEPPCTVDGVDVPVMASIFDNKV